MYNVIIWRVRITTTALETQQCVLFVVEVQCPCQAYKNIECFTAMVLWRIYVATNNKKYSRITSIKYPSL